MIQNTQIYEVKVTNPFPGQNPDNLSVEQRGFLDNKEVAEYDDFNILTQPLAGETLEDFQNKSRGLIRFRQMCLNLQRGLDDMVEVKTNLSNDKSDQSHILTPSEMTFKLIYTQPDGLTVEIFEGDHLFNAEKDVDNEGKLKHNILKTRDGRVFLKGHSAIKRLIAKALVDDYNMFAEYFNNTSTPSGNPSNWKILPLEVKGLFGSTDTKEELYNALKEAEECVDPKLIVEAKTAMHAEKRLVKTEE